MANLKTCCFKIHDDYYTTKAVWARLDGLIPKDAVIWEAFLLNSHKSKSIQYLQELGYRNVIGDATWDFFEQVDDVNYDLILSNPPFGHWTLKKKILTSLRDTGKPFVIILSSMVLFTKYFKEVFKNHLKDIQVIRPTGKLNFEKLDYKTGETSCKKGGASFYSIFLAFKMNIPEEQLWV